MTIIKKSFPLLLTAGMVVLFGCGDGSGSKIENKTDSLATRVESGVDNLGNKVDSLLNKNPDQNFLEDAVEANTKEIRALTLGQQKGSAQVKSAATKMLSDHKKLGEAVKDYIGKNNITLSDVDTADTDNDLNSTAAGIDFDKAWADKMVDDHKKVINMFEDAQNDVKDAQLKSMITDALPKLRMHLEVSQTLQEKLNKTK
jgi:putative membrane protein